MKKFLFVAGAGAIATLAFFVGQSSNEAPKALTNVKPAEQVIQITPPSDDVRATSLKETDPEQVNIQPEPPRPPVVIPLPPPTAEKTSSDCNPNYSGCLKQNAGDYDCIGGKGNGPNYTGKVQVLGVDEYDLDRDGDGWGCNN